MRDQAAEKIATGETEERWLPPDAPLDMPRQVLTRPRRRMGFGWLWAWLGRPSG